MKPYHWRDDPFGAIIPPKKEYGQDVYECVAFGFKTVEDGRALFSGEKAGYAYSRINEGNPTVRAFEKAILLGETGGEKTFEEKYDALAFASGMAAEFVLALSLCHTKKHIVSSPWIYGGTYALFNKVLPKYGGGIQTTFVENPIDIASWKNAVRDDTAFLWVESPANPFGVIDIPAVAALARSLSLPLFVDNTICTHALQKPLFLGADGIITSASKGINGYSNALGGVLVLKKELIQNIKNELSPYVGATMDASAAARMLVGLHNLDERMKKHSENALIFAQWCEKHPRIKKVHYHFLPTSPFYEIAKKQMRGGSCLLSIELDGSLDDARKVMEAFRVIITAPHLGHTHALGTHPASTTHSKVPPEERKRIGISDTLLRFSIGSLQNVQDVIEDIEQALK